MICEILYDSGDERVNGVLVIQVALCCAVFNSGGPVIVVSLY